MHIRYVLGNISKYFTVDNIKKTGLHGYAQDFSVDHESINVDNILDINEYLMEKRDIKYHLNLTKSVYWIIKPLHYSKFWWIVSLYF